MKQLFSLVAALATFLAFIPLALAEAPADTWSKAQAEGSIRWGADQEGGAPYIFPSEQNQDVMIGFEVDIAEKLTEQLKVKVNFQQSQWDTLPSMLQANKIDFVMNGYEWMPDRVEAMETSIPYYVYALQLMVSKTGQVHSWEDFKKPTKEGEKWRVGVLSASAAEEYMKQFDQVELSSYDGVTDAMREVETGKLDATLQDTPITSFYGKDFPGLQDLGDPVSPGYYVIYARKGDRALIDQLNASIITLFRNGTLEKIYNKYGMWNKDQDQLAQILENGKFYGYINAVGQAKPEAEQVQGNEKAEAAPQEAERSYNEKIMDFGWMMVQGATYTILLACISFPIAIILGLTIAVGRLYGPIWLRVPLTAYVEFLRGTPLMLQLYFIFYFLPDLGVNIPAFPTAILGLAINYSAYESEIYRAGLQAIPSGQMEAALSLGMSRVTALRRIIVPQAVRIVIPPVVNDFIALFKDTSVCSVVTIVELTKSFSILSRNNVAMLGLLMVMTCLLYLAMSYPMSIIAGRIERKLARETS